MTLTKQFINDTKKAYKNIARLEIDGNKLVIRNILTGVLHPFKDGKYSMPVPKSERVKIYEWI